MGGCSLYQGRYVVLSQLFVCFCMIFHAELLFRSMGFLPGLVELLVGLYADLPE